MKGYVVVKHLLFAHFITVFQFKSFGHNTFRMPLKTVFQLVIDSPTRPVKLLFEVLLEILLELGWVLLLIVVRQCLRDLILFVADAILASLVDGEGLHFVQTNLHAVALAIWQSFIVVDEANIAIIQCLKVIHQLKSTLTSQPSQYEAIFPFQLQWQILAKESDEKVAAELLGRGAESLDVLVDGFFVVKCGENVVLKSRDDGVRV